MTSADNYYNVIKNTKNNFKFYHKFYFDTEAYRYKTNKQIIEKFNFSEDVVEIQKMSVFVIYDPYRDLYLHGRTTEQLLKIINSLLNEYHKITIFAHNYKYDIILSGLFKYIFQDEELLGLRRNKLIIENLFYARFSNSKGNQQKIIQFIDTTNYWKQPLSELAKHVGMEKFATKEDYSMSVSLWNNYIHKNGLELCKIDCKILYEVVNEFSKNAHYKETFTVSKLAFTVFQNDFLKEEISIPKTLLLPSLKSYRGGYTNNFTVHSEPLNYVNSSEYKKPLFLWSFDVNSLYPFVMRNNKYSVEYRCKLKEPDLQKDYIIANIINDNYNYLLNIDFVGFDINKENPVLTSNNKLMPFFENKDQWITGKEYYYLYKSNYNIKINEVYEFKSNYIFKEYIDYFYEQKKNSAGMVREFNKKMQNTLYGKFAQHTKEIIIFTENNIDGLFEFCFNDNTIINIIFRTIEHIKNNGKIHADIKIVNKDRDINFHLSLYNGFINLSKKIENDISNIYYNPLIASEITANARLYMYSLREKIGFEHIKYQDTDSLFCDYDISEKFPELVGNELGQLKNDKKGYFFINAPKDYSYVEDFSLDPLHTTLKGINIHRDKYIGNNKYEHLQFSGFKDKNNTNNLMVITKIIKTHDPKPDKLNYKLKRQYKDINEYLELTKSVNYSYIVSNNNIL